MVEVGVLRVDSFVGTSDFCDGYPATMRVENTGPFRGTVVGHQIRKQLPEYPSRAGTKRNTLVVPSA